MYVLIGDELINTYQINMKKLLKVLFCIAMVLALVGCTTETPAATKDSKYDVYNVTGKEVVELYLYEVGSSDKGENYAATPIAKNAMVTLSTTVEEDKVDGIVYVLEFKMDGGETEKFETLHFEEASIYLKSLDAAAGATVISFSEPEEEAVYNITNATGLNVTALYIYEVGSSDKGENYAADGLAKDETVTVKFTELATKTSSHVYVLEFEAEGCEPQTFDTLHFEKANISLRNIDEAAGATQIAFGY